MAKFKVGDRVRLDWPNSRFHKNEARIIDIQPTPRGSPLLQIGELAYYLDVIGYGRFGPEGQEIVPLRRGSSKASGWAGRRGCFTYRRSRFGA